MRPKKLTPGQRIALEIFLTSFNETYSFKEILRAIRIENLWHHTVWDQVIDMEPTFLAMAIKHIAGNIDRVYKIELRNK